MANSTSNTTTNWSICCLCQKETEEALSMPKNEDKSGYRTLASNIPAFHEIGALPLPINIKRLDDGRGIEETLKYNSAKYHNLCKLLFNNTKLERAKQKCAQKRQSTSQDIRDTFSSPKVKRKHTEMGHWLCFICDREDIKSSLRQIETMQTCHNLKAMATELNDVKLLKSLSIADPIAQELKYHPRCLASIHNRLRSLRHLCEKEAGEDQSTHSAIHPIAFSELITYIHEKRLSSNGSVVFKLAELRDMIIERLKQLGVETPDVNTTRLKENLIQHFPELEAYKQGRNIVLAFKKDVGPLLSKLSEFEDAIIVAKAAQILRKQMLECKSKFPGNFDAEYIATCVPQQLTQFVSSLSHGADIKSQIEFGTSKTDIALSHILQYNCHKTFKEDATFHRQNRSV